MTGSIKDRMALYILRHGHVKGALGPGAPIAEATSGNTGIAFAAIGRTLGHPVTIFMPNRMSQERKDLIRSLGAEVRLVGSLVPRRSVVFNAPRPGRDSGRATPAWA